VAVGEPAAPVRYRADAVEHDLIVGGGVGCGYRVEGEHQVQVVIFRDPAVPGGGVGLELGHSGLGAAGGDVEQAVVTRNPHRGRLDRGEAAGPAAEGDLPGLDVPCGQAIGP